MKRAVELQLLTEGGAQGVVRLRGGGGAISYATGSRVHRFCYRAYYVFFFVNFHLYTLCIAANAKAVATKCVMLLMRHHESPSLCRR